VDAGVTDADVVVVGAGAAGLATAIFAARSAPGVRVVCLDGAAHLGAKILVSGGSRCNVTNRAVTERDFWGAPSRLVRHVLRAFPAAKAAAFFAELGVALHEEDDGKLFPDTNRSRTVLDALLAEAARRGVALRPSHRVTGLASAPAGFITRCGAASLSSRAVVLATGGRSLPKSGSDGFGYTLAAALGHGCVDTTPALAPLLLSGDRHARLSGVAHPAALTLRVRGVTAVRLEGALLWTHFGASGPVVLNLSRHWHRAVLEGGGRADVQVALNLLPGETFDSVEAWLLSEAAARPRARIATVLGQRVPNAVVEAWLHEAGLESDVTMAHLARDARRTLVHALTQCPLDVRDSRGYAFAEVTAGGVPLDEVDTATMESRVCPGLYLTGEILDVDGRLGGFNFQWAWSSGWVAGQAIARRLAPS
jgi:predicted Rossmann fold flavoprotein